MLEYLLEMGALAPEEEDLARQRALVDQLRSTPQPGMRNAGRVMVAANPLEHVAGVLGQGLASYKEQGANTASKALQDKRLQGISRMRNRFGAGGGAGGLQQLGGPGVDSYDPADGYASPL
jgi:hypothetical protein